MQCNSAIIQLVCVLDSVHRGHALEWCRGPSRCGSRLVSSLICGVYRHVVPFCHKEGWFDSWMKKHRSRVVAVWSSGRNCFQDAHRRGYVALQHTSSGGGLRPFVTVHVNEAPSSDRLSGTVQVIDSALTSISLSDMPNADGRRHSRAGFSKRLQVRADTPPDVPRRSRG